MAAGMMKRRWLRRKTCATVRVAEPCVIQPEMSDIQLTSGLSSTNTCICKLRTHSQTRVAPATGVRFSLGNTVAITLTGTENAKLPGLLALDAGSLASGIGIGLEDSTGALPLTAPAINSA